MVYVIDSFSLLITQVQMNPIDEFYEHINLSVKRLQSLNLLIINLHFLLHPPDSTLDPLIFVNHIDHMSPRATYFLSFVQRLSLSLEQIGQFDFRP